MQRSAVFALALGVVGAGAAEARSYEGCTKYEVAVADAAIDGAVALARLAAGSVAESEDYVRWFGTYDATAAAGVRGGFAAIHATLLDPSLTIACIAPARADCKGEDRDDTFAFVLYGRPRAVHLCPSFFRMPGLADARRGLGEKENGTREGTIVHEVSHFPSVAATSDECYTRPACEEMAAGEPALARINADSFQYFAEDVMLRSLAAE
jgi:peptidyl-Lys metalloendopeptidase